MKKAVIIVVIVFLLGAGAFLGVRQANGAQPTPTAQPTLAPVKSSSNIIAQGEVVPVQDTTLSFATGGLISEVSVKEGQVVKAGQVLARLSGNEDLQAALNGAELDVLTAQQGIDRLKQGASVAASQAQVTLVAAQKGLDDAKQHRLNLDYRATPDQIAAANANYIMAQNVVDDKQEAYDSVAHRPENDNVRAISLANLENAKKARDKALINLNWYKGKANPKDIAEADANVALAQSQLEDAQTQLDKVKYGPDADQLSLLQAQLKSAQGKADAARAGLAHLELTAPFAGTVSSIQMKVGAFAQPGVEVAKLADQTSWLVKTTDLTELNVAQIKPGMNAAVKFDALPDVQLNAQVQYIENYGQTYQSDIVYAVVLKLDKPDPRLRWNMTAVVTFPEQ